MYSRKKSIQFQDEFTTYKDNYKVKEVGYNLQCIKK